MKGGMTLRLAIVEGGPGRCNKARGESAVAACAPHVLSDDNDLLRQRATADVQAAEVDAAG